MAGQAPEHVTPLDAHSEAEAEGAPAERLLHASAVGWGGRALVFTGPSGSGKSTLCLALMAYGAALIADDRVLIRRDQAGLHVCAPAHFGGMVEARGIGLLAAPPDEAPDIRCDLAAIVQLDRKETDRLPPFRETDLLGVNVAEIRRSDGPHFAPALLQFLKAGRVA